MSIKELKEKTGQEAENLIAAGIPLESKGSKYRCPNKSAHNHGDRNPSMSWDSEALQFYCFTCGEKIDIYEYYKTYEGLDHKAIMEKAGINYNSKATAEEDFDMKEEVKELPNTKLSPLAKKQLEYLKTRKLEGKTCEVFKLGDIDNGNIGLPYINNSNEIIGIKIKNLKSKAGPKYYSAKNSSYNLFNSCNVPEDEKTLVVAEGEFDCMILFQCGYKNSVSVGSGANSLNKLFREEKAFLDRFTSIIVLSDNDEAGKKMTKKFIEKFGYKVKTPNKDLYLNLKDINAIYYKHGKQQIDKIIKSAESKIEGLRNLDTDPYKGVDEIQGNYIPTGIPSIDYAMNDLSPGTVTLLAGRSNSGKSTLTQTIIAYAIEKGNKVLLVAGEGLQEIIINQIYRVIIGSNPEHYTSKRINKRYFKEPTIEALEKLQKWHKNKLTIFNKGESELKTTDQLFEFLRMEINTNKYNLIIIDNLMSCLSVQKAAEKLEAQGDFVQKLSDLAKAENLSAILNLHLNKESSKSKNMDFEGISGSSDIYNKADNILMLRRVYDEEKISQGINGVVKLVKNRYFNDLVEKKLHYDSETNTLEEIGEDGSYFKYHFSWNLDDNPAEEWEVSKEEIPLEFLN